MGTPVRPAWGLLLAGREAGGRDFSFLPSLLHCALVASQPERMSLLVYPAWTKVLLLHLSVVMVEARTYWVIWGYMQIKPKVCAPD